MHNKAETATITINCLTLIHNQFHTKIKILRTDGGGEFHNAPLTQFLTTSGIIHQNSCPYTPQQNGLVEHKHRHLLETTRSLLFNTSLPSQFWVEALLTATYLINRLPSPITHHISPYQRLFKSKPALSHLKIFGCTCYPLLPTHQRTKLTPKTYPCIFLGYCPTSKVYKCLNPHTHQYITSRNITFDEGLFHYKNSSPPIKTPSTSASQDLSHPLLLSPITTSPPNSLTTLNPPNSPQPMSTHSTSLPNPTSLPSSIPPSDPPQPIIPTHHMVTRAKIGSLKSKIPFTLLHTTSAHTEPTSYSQAVK